MTEETNHMEVTPEMLEAGWKAWAEHEGYSHNVLASAYLAMKAKEQPTTEEKNTRAAEELDAMQRQREIVERLYTDGGPDAKLSARCHEVVKAMWDTTHNNHLPKHEMLTALSLISGFACAVLHDAAEVLEEDGQ